MLRTITAVLCAVLAMGEASLSADETTTTKAEKGIASEATTVEKLDSVQLPENDIAKGNVTMWCTIGNNGHSVRESASNSSGKNYSCSSSCYYKRSDGANGVLSCNGTVPANANHVEFCSASDGTYTFTITNVGSYSCQ